MVPSRMGSQGIRSVIKVPRSRGARDHLVLESLTFEFPGVTRVWSERKHRVHYSTGNVTDDCCNIAVPATHISQRSKFTDELDNVRSARIGLQNERPRMCMYQSIGGFYVVEQPNRDT